MHEQIIVHRQHVCSIQLSSLNLCKYMHNACHSINICQFTSYMYNKNQTYICSLETSPFSYERKKSMSRKYVIRLVSKHVKEISDKVNLFSKKKEVKFLRDNVHQELDIITDVYGIMQQHACYNHRNRWKDRE